MPGLLNQMPAETLSGLKKGSKAAEKEQEEEAAAYAQRVNVTVIDAGLNVHFDRPTGIQFTGLMQAIVCGNVENITRRISLFSTREKAMDEEERVRFAASLDEVCKEYCLGDYEYTGADGKPIEVRVRVNMRRGDEVVAVGGGSRCPSLSRALSLSPALSLALSLLCFSPCFSFSVSVSVF